MDGRIMAEEDKEVAAAGTAGKEGPGNTEEDLGIVFTPATPAPDEPEEQATEAGGESRDDGEAPPPDAIVLENIDASLPLKPIPGQPISPKPAPIIQATPPVPDKNPPAPTQASAPIAPAPSVASGPPPVSPPAAPIEIKSQTGEALKKKEFPSPQELKREPKKEVAVPTKTSLDKIELPAYMKGFFTKKLQGKGAERKVSPTVARGIREIGVREVGVQPPPSVRGPMPSSELHVVSIAKDKRTEIDENGLSRVRTYAADMSDEIRRRGASLSTIVGAEREREVEKRVQTTVVQKTGERRLVLLAIAVVLLVGGVSAVAAAVYFSNQEPPPEIAPGIILENTKTTITANEEEFVKDLAVARRDAELKLGEIERFIIVDENGVELSAQSIFALLGAPSELSRNVKRVMLGVHAFDRNQPFLIAEVSFYDLAFSAMLSWENDIGESLGIFFAPVGLSSVAPTLHFSDSIFKNIDTRRSDGPWPIVYAFPEEKLLVITTNQNTLAEILARLAITRSR